MRTLVAHGIVPDVIVGTSIGAVVGGCYAAGQLDELESWARGLTVRGMLQLSRHQSVRRRPDPRQPSRQPARRRRLADKRIEDLADPLCRDRHRIRHRP